MTKESFLDSLSPRLTGVETARLVPKESASVAVIFRNLDGGEEAVLLIRRAEREGDPWSGQVAFPGGMVSVADESFEATARRETLEEVGIDLSPKTAAFLGYMRELKARMREVVVCPVRLQAGSGFQSDAQQGGGLLRVGHFEEPSKGRGPLDAYSKEK